MSTANNIIVANYVHRVMLCPFRQLTFVPADPPRDYAVTVNFSKGERYKSVTVPILDDFECEDTKTQSFVISMNTDALRVEISPQVDTTEIFIDDTNETECGMYIYYYCSDVFIQ